MGWDGGGERRGGKGCLIVYRGGVPWVLGKSAGWSWAKGFQYLSMGLSHCSKSLYPELSGITHPFDF